MAAASLPTLALVGHAVAGKGVATEFFRGQGYNPIDTGGLIRMQLRQLGNVQPTRDEEGEHARLQRSRHGPGYFTQLGMDQLPGPHLVEGSRSPAEIDDLLARGIVIFAVTATLARRYLYNQHRQLGSSGRFVPQTLKEFEEFDWRDRGFVWSQAGEWAKGADPMARDTDYAVDHAHVIIHNDGTPADLRAALHDSWGHLGRGCIGFGRSVRHYGHWREGV